MNLGLDVVAAARWSSDGVTVTVDSGYKVRSAAYSLGTGEITFTLDESAGPLDFAFANAKDDPNPLQLVDVQGQVADAYVAAPGNQVHVRTRPNGSGVFAGVPRGGSFLLYRGVEPASLAITLGA